MRTASPLRYPGGKSSMTSLLAQIRRLNRLGDRTIAEPFAGGAGASLSLLFLEETPEIHINDADTAIHAFWWALTNRPKQFADMISDTNVNMTEWHCQRDVYRRQCRTSLLRRGFAAFYLNRCNRSGIIMNGGPIGGVDQTGKWKLNARFNKSELISRCEKIAQYKNRIRISCQDGLKFINEHDSKSTFLFIDPPYYAKGKTLYLNSLDEDYHIALGQKLKSLADASWVLTYDDCPEIREIYQGWANIRPFSLRYVASERRTGKEVLIVPKWMILPDTQGSSAIGW